MYGRYIFFLTENVLYFYCNYTLNFRFLSKVTVILRIYFLRVQFPGSTGAIPEVERRGCRLIITILTEIVHM